MFSFNKQLGFTLTWEPLTVSGIGWSTEPMMSCPEEE
jgi:hypothetical protein